MSDFAQRRRMMVDCQVRTFDVTNLDLIDAMLDVPREVFVPDNQQALAYSDHAIRVAGDSGQTRIMLVPMVLARLIQGLDIRPGERVLDVGCGTGYGSCLMARLGAKVTALEADAALAGAARAALSKAGAADVEVVQGALADGHMIDGGYDAIVLNGSFDVLPEKLLEQLAQDGRLGGFDAREGATKAVIMRRAAKGYSRQPLFSAAAVVLAGLEKKPEFVF